MATDDERREVARSLREIPDSMTYSADRIGKTVLEMFSPNGVFHGNGRKAFNRLADLIEPDTTKPGSDTTKCDRDALLALADKLECDGDCNGCDMGGGIWCGAQVYAACRIREALGVSDD